MNRLDLSLKDYFKSFLFDSNSIFIKEELKEIDALRLSFSSQIFTKLTQKTVLKDKCFCYEKSIKSHLKYNCLLCPNDYSNHILRIYFERKEHKDCRIHVCLFCYNSLTSMNIYVRCFICRQFLVNFNRISKIKGGKDKKIYEQTEYVDVDMY